MSAEPLLVVHPTAEDVAAVTAGRLLAVLTEALAARGTADVVVTGGGVGTGILRALASAPGREAVGWASVHVWWGDDRWVPAQDDDRNEKQARDAVFGLVPATHAVLHPMAPREPGQDVSAMTGAAAAYAAELAARAAARGESGPMPAFDVLMLGTGPEGHVASLFPDTAGVRSTESTVVAVTDSPKPPPERLSLTLPAIRTAREVWIVTAGAEKAEAIAAAVAGRPAEEFPVAGARGTEKTLLLVDRLAAGR